MTDKIIEKIKTLRVGPLKSMIEEEWPLYVLLCDAWRTAQAHNCPMHRYHLYCVLYFLKKIAKEQGDGALALYLLSEIELLISIFWVRWGKNNDIT